MTFLHPEHNSTINLSAKEMLEISQEISRDFTPYFSSQASASTETTRLTPRELLDIGEEISYSFAPTPLRNTPELMLLPVDPEHLYAYWHLGENAEDIASSDKDRFTLRIYSQPKQQRPDNEAPSWFDVALDSPKTQQQVYLPRQLDDITYSAAIGKRDTENRFTAFAYSNSIQTPQSPKKAQHHTPKNRPHCPTKNASGQGTGK